MQRARISLTYGSGQNQWATTATIYISDTLKNCVTVDKEKIISVKTLTEYLFDGIINTLNMSMMIIVVL